MLTEAFGTLRTNSLAQSCILYRLPQAKQLQHFSSHVLAAFEQPKQYRKQLASNDCAARSSFGVSLVTLKLTHLTS